MGAASGPFSSSLWSSRQRERTFGVRDTKESRDGGLDRALTLSQLADRLGVKPQTIYDLRSEGRGPKGFRIGSNCGSARA